MPPANEGAAAKLLAVGEDDGDVLGGTANSTFAFLTGSVRALFVGGSYPGSSP